MSRGTNQFMLLQLLLFVLLSTTAFMNYSYASSSLANNSNQHITGNNSSRFVTLDQLSAVAVMDLTGSITEGCYRVMLKLGQHAQPYSFLIDTGSDLTWVNCQQRSSYQYPHPPYNPPARNTIFCGDPLCHHVIHPSEHPCNYTTDICHYVREYEDGGYTMGKMILDSLTLPFNNVHRSLLPPTIKIGCGFDNRRPPGSMRLPFDGVLGLANDSPITIVEQLVNKGIVRPVFGHCMSRPRGGYFFIGAGQVLPHAITWAPMVTLRPKLYSPGRANLVFDGRHTTVTNLETIFDSGSTYSYFKRSVVQAMIRLVLTSLNGVGAPLTPFQETFYPICWRRSRPIRSVDQVAAYFKTMTLIFPAANNGRFELPPYTYLTVVPSGEVCFAILDGTRHSFGEVNLIGGSTLRSSTL